jgi:hypothetical protein
VEAPVHEGHEGHLAHWQCRSRFFEDVDEVLAQYSAIHGVEVVWRHFLVYVVEGLVGIVLMPKPRLHITMRDVRFGYFI